MLVGNKKMKERRGIVMKKIIRLGIIALIMLGFFGLTACDDESLADYKATKSQTLQEYADAKGVENYSTEGWQAVCKAVVDGKSAINAATTKFAVTTAYNDAKGVIDEVEDLGLETKIIWSGTIADIVDNETILITIDKHFNAKEFTVDDFKMVEIVEESFAWLTKTAYDERVENGTLTDDFRHIIIIKITDKGAQNLINAIRVLEAVNFVNSASPNRYYNPDD